MRRKFGPAFGRQSELCPRPSPSWRLDEMAVVIGGKRLWLWRGVDSEGEILDLLVQPRRDRRAALRLMRKLLRMLLRPVSRARVGARVSVSRILRGALRSRGAGCAGSAKAEPEPRPWAAVHRLAARPSEVTEGRQRLG